MLRQIIPPPEGSRERSMNTKREFSEGRKQLYYVGMVLSGIGILLFLSVFVTGCMNFGNFSNFESRARGEMGRAIGGMVLIVAGRIIGSLGSKGVAGSGLKLDPQQAREELEPWSRMSGGILRDTLDEAGINLSYPSKSNSLPPDEQLRRLEQLKKEGLITEDEYAAARKRIIDSFGTTA